MDVLILTESGPGFGFGHLTRCIAIREAFESYNIGCQIKVHSDHHLPENFNNEAILARGWYRDKHLLFEILEGKDVVIVDSYYCEIEFLEIISRYVRTPVFIDDFNRLEYPAGIVLNGNSYGSDLRYKKFKEYRHLLGPKYLVLRKAFWNVAVKEVQEHIQRVLVTLGTGSFIEITQKILFEIKKCYPESEIDVISNHEDFDSLDSQAERVHYHHQLASKDMKRVIEAADLAISSGGQITYELSKCGTPYIAITTADNQKKNINKLYENRLIMDTFSINEKDLIGRISRLLSKYNEQSMRLNQSRRATALFSGNGAANVVEAIVGQFELQG